MSVYRLVYDGYHQTISSLNAIGSWLPSLLLRLFVAWEFGEAGYEKLHGTNWFSDISFPFPFNLLPADFSWYMAMGFELIGAVAILLGFATRFFSLSLIILTIVAISAVHWPEQWNTLSELLMGYRFSDRAGDGFGNYKLPLIYILTLIPLLLSGAGKLSFDYALKHK